jgi:ATP-dependent RNA helicase DHX29
VQRESARQVTRLQTERRVLRGQTERLHIRQWLPPEALEEIADLTRREEVNGAFRSDQEHSKDPSSE